MTDNFPLTTSKPKIFVAVRSGFNMKFMCNELNKKYFNRFDFHYWPYDRPPSLEEMKVSVNGVFGIICHPPATIDSEVIEAAGENLKVILSASVGLDHLDIETLKAKGIRIAFEGAQIEMTVAVAEYAIGLLFATVKHIAKDYATLRQDTNSWFNVSSTPITNKHSLLWNSVVGIIGCGNIGIEIAKRLPAFSLKQLLYSSRKRKLEVDAVGGEWRSDDDVCKQSDFIIITLQLNKETHHLINRARLNLMKSNAILLNVSRGGVIDEEALVEVLRTKTIAGAGLDVLEEEPIHANNPLLSLDNVVITPHAAGNAFIAWNKRLKLLKENILAAYENRKMQSELL